MSANQSLEPLNKGHISSGHFTSLCTLSEVPLHNYLSHFYIVSFLCSYSNTPEANPGMPVNEKASACIPNDGVTVATKPQGVATFPTQSPLGHSKPLLGTGISRSGI